MKVNFYDYLIEIIPETEKELDYLNRFHKCMFIFTTDNTLSEDRVPTISIQANPLLHKEMYNVKSRDTSTWK